MKRRDHPRVCGEKLVKVAQILHNLGSPPRMRGKVRIPSVLPISTGITPAYAGKSTAEPRLRITTGDHPRVCGEKLGFAQVPGSVLGSPPRMRGKDVQRNGKGRKNGITPAYAGKRLKRSHSIGHFSCILCLFHSVLHRASASGGSRAGPCAPPCLPAQNAIPV